MVTATLTFLEHATRCLASGRPQPDLRTFVSPDGGIYALSRLSYDAARVDASANDISRHRALLPLAQDAVTLGAGGTPIDRIELFGCSLLAKDETENPTGSFKDRGMCVLANLARGEKGPVHVDSVGNTAASLARYASALGLEAHVFAPLATSTSRAKIVTDLRARLHLVAGPRAESAKAAIAAAEAGSLYLSHVYQPLFQAGTATCAFEIFEATGTELPDRIFLAVGQGSLLLGLWHGFSALVRAGEIERSPSLYAIRPRAPRRTVAVGASAEHPVRAQETRAAARASGGRVIRVDEPALARARSELRGKGLSVDPAVALAVAGWLEVSAREGEKKDLVILTGADREASARRKGAAA